MAVEKLNFNTVDALEISRLSLENSLDRLIEVFKSHPKSTIKTRLKNAEPIKWVVDVDKNDPK